MKRAYHDLMERISVPEGLEDRVLAAARQKQTAQVGPKHLQKRRWVPLLRGAACAACALALLLGTVTLSPGQSSGAAVPLAYTFGLTAYAAETGETTAPNANGGLAFLSGEGTTDSEEGRYTGCLFRITGENIRTVSVSVDRGGLYRRQLRTNLTEQEMDQYRRDMESGKIPAAAISRSDDGVWSMPLITSLGASFTEGYDPEVSYGFRVPPESLPGSETDSGAALSLFDGAALTVAVTYTDGSTQEKVYTLSTGRLRVSRDTDGTQVMLPQLAGEGEPWVWGVYAESQAEGRWLDWPVQDSRTISLSCPYGAVNGRSHDGIDIPAAQGAVILAAAAGTVTETGFDPELGNYLVLDHGGGLTTLYAHCRDLTVRKDDTVRAGEMVAAVGATGMATGPCLHFAVRQDGTPQSPVAYFSREVRETLLVQ